MITTALLAIISVMLLNEIFWTLQGSRNRQLDSLYRKIEGEMSRTIKKSISRACFLTCDDLSFCHFHVRLNKKPGKRHLTAGRGCKTRRITFLKGRNFSPRLLCVKKWISTSCATALAFEAPFAYVHFPFTTTEDILVMFDIESVRQTENEKKLCLPESILFRVLFLSV